MRVWILLAGFVAIGCGKTTADPTPVKSATSTISPPFAGRIVAVGDVHGDLSALQKALVLAEVVDAKGHWSGGETVLVQTGDILDRGDDEQALLDWIERLKREAKATGGRVVALNGNHEAMNVMGDLRYVTPGGLTDFADAPGVNVDDPAVAKLPLQVRARMAAFRPGGPYALKLAEQPMVAKVGDSIFVHGGVLPRFARIGLDTMNGDMARWMRGQTPVPKPVTDSDGPLWSRHFSADPDEADCALLAESLEILGARRMVVGHTVHLNGIKSGCNGQVWRIDTGMASYYGGMPQALEIKAGKVRPLSGP